MRLLLAQLTVLLASTPLLLLTACADDAGLGPTASPDAGDDFDRDASAPLDAGVGFADSGTETEIDGALPVPMTEENGVGFDGLPPQLSGERVDLDPATCFDGVNDTLEDTAFDCASTTCVANHRSCCVGSSATACCDAAVESGLSIDLASCTGNDITTCTGAFERFGAPIVQASTIRVDGDALGDSGLVSHEALDTLNDRVRIEFEVRHAVACGASCLETLGVGLVTEAPGSTSQPLETSVALSYSGAKENVALLLDGVRWMEFDLADAPTSSFALELAPTGDIHVDGPRGSADVSGAFAPGALHLAVFGRSRDATSNDAAALGRLGVSTARCDIPSAWATRASIVLDASAPVGGEHPSATWTASDDLAMAFALGDAIYLQVGDDIDLLGEPTEFDTGGAVHDVDVIANGDLVEIYFVRETADGPRPYRVDTEADGRFGEMPAMNPLAIELDVSALAAARPLDSATRVYVLATPAGPQVWFDDTTRAAFHLDALSSSSSLATLLADREIEDLSLVVHQRAWQLLVGTRRGARRSTELYASDDLLHWRLVGEALTPGETGFDAISLRQADLVTGWGTDNLGVVYLGNNGTAETFGYALRHLEASE